MVCAFCRVLHPVAGSFDCTLPPGVLPCASGVSGVHRGGRRLQSTIDGCRTRVVVGHGLRGTPDGNGIPKEVTPLEAGVPVVVPDHDENFIIPACSEDGKNCVTSVFRAAGDEGGSTPDQG